MLEAAGKTLKPQRMQMESCVMCELLYAGHLAASPRAAILLDPCVCTAPERSLGPAFIFSDIPDKHFREPGEIIHLSHRYSAGGVKS